MKRFLLIVSCLLLTFALSAQELQDEKESPPRYQGFAAGGDLLTQFALGDYSKFALMNLGGSLAGEYTLPLELPRNMDLGLALRAEFAHVFVKADTALKADEEIRAFGAAWLRIPFMLGNQFFAFQPELGGGLSVFLSKYEIKGESKSNTYLSPLISIAPSFRWIPEPLQKLEVEAAPLFTIVPEKEKATMMLGLRLGAIWHFQLKNETDKEDKKAVKLAKAEEKRQKKEAERLEAEEKRRKEEERLAAEEDKRRKKEEEKALREEEKRRQEEEKTRLEEEAEKQRLAEEAEKARLAEEAEKQRLAEEAEKARKAEEERLAAEEAEKQRLAEEAEKVRKAEEERLAAEEAEKQRLANEAEKARKAEEERLAVEEAEKQRLAEEAEKARLEEEAKRLAEEEAARLAAEEAEKARLAEEAEKARKAEEERLAAEEAENQRLAEEAEKARKAAEPAFITERLGLKRILFFSKNGAVFSGLSREQIRQNEKTIDKAVELIKEHPECKVIIEGYANNISGTEEEDRTACQPLSLWRAEYIKKELTKRGIAADRIETVGKGGANPLASRSDRDNWWKNRRVEFVITYESEVQDE